MNLKFIFLGSLLVVFLFPLFSHDGELNADNYRCNTNSPTTSKLQVTLCFRKIIKKLEAEKADLQVQLVKEKAKINEAIETEAYNCDSNIRNRDGFS